MVYSERDMSCKSGKLDSYEVTQEPHISWFAALLTYFSYAVLILVKKILHKYFVLFFLLFILNLFVFLFYILIVWSYS